ncbi:MAG: hypothetical protein BRD24_02620 [Halobacteriales archaeon SW_9_67_24]|nr:MAG: hypothetical protein BRD24_02620 [Halobacteriales archaeon SW_9_67_24]
MTDEQPTTEPAAERSHELLKRVNEQVGSEYDLLSTTGKVGAGAAALGVAGTGTAAAGHADADYSDSEYEDTNQFGYGALTDVQIVKFALLLERLEATFYTEAVGGRLGEVDVESSAIAQQLANPSLRYATFQRLKQVRDHEQTHVEALEGVLEAVGSDPDFGSDVEFEFPYETVGEFYDLAQVFEDTGVAAYTTAAPAIDTEKYLASAVRIHAVEGRHASYLRTLNNPLPAGSAALNPFPRAFQLKLSVSDVVGRIEPFVVGADAEDIVGLLSMDESAVPDTASATFEDQSTDGSSVTVASAALPDGGFVAMHDSSLLDGNVAGSVIGVSEKYDAGTVMKVEVPLYSGVPGSDFDQSALQEDQTLIAMPHKDTNDNGTYDFITSGGEADGAYVQDGSAVVDDAEISVN